MKEFNYKFLKNFGGKLYEVARFLDKLGCHLMEFDRTIRSEVWGDETGETVSWSKTCGVFEHAGVKYGFFADTYIRPSVEVFTVASPYRWIKDLHDRAQFMEFIKKEENKCNIGDIGKESLPEIGKKRFCFPLTDISNC